MTSHLEMSGEETSTAFLGLSLVKREQTCDNAI